MSQVLDKMERLAGMAERLGDLADKIPRLAEMFGVAFLAGKASEKLGGDFAMGALGGIVADGLAHSNIPHNQVGGVSLGTYFAALGVLTLTPGGVEQFTTPRIVTSLTREECATQGGVVIESFLSSIGLAPPACRLPD